MHTLNGTLRMNGSTLTMGDPKAGYSDYTAEERERRYGNSECCTRTGRRDLNEKWVSRSTQRRENLLSALGFTLSNRHVSMISLSNVSMHQILITTLYIHGADIAISAFQIAANSCGLTWGYALHTKQTSTQNVQTSMQVQIHKYSALLRFMKLCKYVCKIIQRSWKIKQQRRNRNCGSLKSQST